MGDSELGDEASEVASEADGDAISESDLFDLESDGEGLGDDGLDGMSEAGYSSRQGEEESEGEYDASEAGEDEAGEDEADGAASEAASEGGSGGDPSDSLFDDE